MGEKLKMRDFITQNTQKRVVINCATMSEVMELKREILKALKEHQISNDLITGKGDLLERDINLTEILNFMKDILITMDISRDLETVLFKCLGHCTYDTVHVINPELFDTICPDARADYYEIVFSCIEENLKPFMQSLISAWKNIQPKLGNIPNLSLIAQ